MGSVGRLCLIAFALLVFSSAQTQAQQPLRFDVASVHVSDAKPPRSPMPAAGEIVGGPGTGEPTRITYRWMLMRRLLMEAFGVPLDQISGSDWVMGQDARFDIVANVPEGTKKEQIQEMLLNLLQDRFHFTYHRERKDFDVWTLTVAKGGSKLKDAAAADGPPPEPPAPGTPVQRATLDRDGFPQLPPGRTNAQGVTSNGLSRTTFRMATPQTLLGMLQFSLGGRSEDRTGLTGKYDFTLEYSPVGLPGPLAGRLAAAPPGPGPAAAASDPGGPDLFTALEKQLGLKLEKSKTQLDVIVVDHMDRTPTEN
jgi:uncharacterized protein (TIGR03435 family)